MFPIQDDQPKYSPSTVTMLLILVNSLVFLYEISLDEYTRNFLIQKYGLVPAHFHASALLTCMFLHGGWMHIIGNMLFLWAFGRSLEDNMGHAKYLLFYLLCGVAAGITHDYFNMDSSVPTIGASGAIAGVMGAYLVKFPRARIDTLIFFFFITRVDIPAVFMLVYWFITQIVSGVGSIAYSHISQSGTAWFAHIGGFISGMILVSLLGTSTPQWQRRRVSW
jgi:membrane associated rhomboid family serine protease